MVLVVLVSNDVSVSTRGCSLPPLLPQLATAPL